MKLAILTTAFLLVAFFSRAQVQDTTSTIAVMRTKHRVTFVQNGRSLSEKELLSLLCQNSESLPEVRKAKQNLYFGKGVVYLSSFAFGYFVAQSFFDKPQWGLVGLSAGSMLIGAISTSNSYYYRLGRAVDLFNKSHLSGGDLSSQISFGLTPNGVGLVLTF